MFNLPNTHGDKLYSLLHNPKLPLTDRKLVENTMLYYQDWRLQLLQTKGSIDVKIEKLITLILYLSLIAKVILFIDKKVS